MNTERMLWGVIMEFAKTLLSNVWPEWEIIEEIGTGSFGKVYKIKREYIGDREQFSALKVIRIPLKPKDASFAFDADNNSTKEYYKSLVTNIVKEIELMSKVKGHTNIVSYEDHKVIEDENGLGWTILLRMELLMPFSEYIKTNKIGNKEATRLGIDICKALEVCKKYSIVHRDIKTENVFVSETGDFKLGDFGTALIFDKTVNMATMAGTYPYMAPEVMKQEPHGHQSDIYSLGIMLYKLLNKNRFPFYPPHPEKITHDSVQESFRKRLSGEKLPVPCDADKKLSNIILKACEYNRKDRFVNATEMRNALEQETVSEPPAFPWKKVLRIAAYFGAIALIITGIFFGIKFIDKKINTHKNSEIDASPSATVSTVDISDRVIDIYVKNKDIWLPSNAEEAMNGCYYGFADLDNDGVLELITNFNDGSGKYSTNCYYKVDLDNNSVEEIETVTSEKENGFDWNNSNEFKLLRDKKTNETVYFCYNYDRVTYGDYYETNGILKCIDNSIETKDICSVHITENGAATNNTNNAIIEHYFYSENDNPIEKAIYNSCFDLFFENYIDLNVKLSFYDAKEIGNKDNSQLKSQLLLAYNEFDFDGFEHKKEVVNSLLNIEDSDDDLSENKILFAYYNLINKMHENPSAYFENYGDNLTGLKNNEFAFSDVNGDGVTDLLYNYISSGMSNSIMYIWSYDSETKKTYEMDSVSSYSNFYNNGNIRCDLSHNHGFGETIWPYYLMSYNKNANRFIYVSDVYCYDKEYMEERGEVFPAEDDKDNDGIIYYVETDNKTEILTAEEYKKYERKYIPDEALIKLDWKYATEENILAIKAGSPIQHQTNIDNNGNAVNDGLVANDDRYTYYQNHEDNWYLYKTDGNINTRLNTDNTWCINVQDDYVYYANVDDNSTIYKIKKDGTERQKVGSDSCALVIVQGEYIYYKNVSDGDKIYKIGIDGTSRKQVSDDSVSYMAIDNGWIYYCNTKDGYIYRIRTDGTGKQQLNDNISAYLNVYDGWVYYRNDSYNKRIYRIKLDGSEKNLFCNDSASYINVYNGKIYYQNISHNNYLYCISIEDAKKTQLNSNDSRYINIADKKIYYRIGTDTKTLYMLSLQ